MKLRINGFENEIIFDGETVNVLEIRDKECFKHILELIYNFSCGNESLEIVLLSDNEETIHFKDNVIVMFDLFNIDYNSKNILNKLYNMVQNNIEKNQDLEIDEYKFKIREKIIEEINELPFEFEMKDDLNIEKKKKMYSLKIDSRNYDTILNRIELMINLISLLGVANILIIPNLKIYLNNEELLELYKYSLYNNIELLLIEQNSNIKLKYEKIMLIESDFNDSII